MLEASAESAEVLVFCSLTIAALATATLLAVLASEAASMASTVARRFSAVASALLRVDVACRVVCSALFVMVSALALVPASEETAVVRIPSAKTRALVSVDTASTRASVSVLILAFTLPASVAGSSMRSMRLFSAVLSSAVVISPASWSSR